MAANISTNAIEQIEDNFLDLFNPHSLFDTVTQGGIAIQFVMGAAFLLGLLITGKGIMQLAANSQDARRSNSSALLHIVSGILLMYALALLKMGLTTVYGYGFDEVESIAVINNSDRLLNIVIMVVQFIGIVGFIKGILLLRRMGAGQAGQGAGFKALTYLIGGLLATNIVLTTRLVVQLFGLEINT